MKITKKRQREIVKDIRRQLKWVSEAIDAGDQEWVDIYADQLAASGSLLHSEEMRAS